MSIGKIYDSFDEAIADIPDGATVMIGGFGSVGGTPSSLIQALYDRGVKNLTIISNSGGHGDLTRIFLPPNGYIDPGILYEKRQVRKVICSAPVIHGYPPTPCAKAVMDGEVELEIVPQGTLAERIKAGGSGIGAFYTPTGVGTLLEAGKEKRVIEGREMLLETALSADYALIQAHKSDRMGNLVYRGTCRNLNPLMAAAAKVTIAEVDQIVETGELDPEVVVTPGIFVHRVVAKQGGRAQ